MTPRLRKVMLLVHVACSVGWLGAVVAFLALAIAGVTGGDPQRVRAMYLGMELTAWFVIVPFSLAALVTGIVQSLGTEWGLLRHYWIAIKLLMNVLSTAVLLLHMQPIGRLAAVAAEMNLSGAGLEGLQVQLVADAAAALLVLLVATALSVFKPRGVIRDRQRRPRGTIQPRKVQDAAPL